MALNRLMVVTVAHGLIESTEPNPEYDRALAELTTELLGLPLGDFAGQVLRMLREGPVEPCCDDAPYCDLCGEWRVRWRLDDIGVCDGCLAGGGLGDR